MKFRALATLALALAMASPGAAYADYTVKGSIECPDVVREDDDTNFRAMNKWWVLGYFSGRNFERDKFLDDALVGKGIDSDALYGLVLGYCRDHPGNDLDDASHDLYDRLQ